jgi:hypothetical protein
MINPSPKVFVLLSFLEERKQDEQTVQVIGGTLDVGTDMPFLNTSLKSTEH